jgi:hypothetical protein
MKNIQIYICDRRLVVDCHLGQRRSAFECPSCHLCASGADGIGPPFKSKDGEPRGFPSAGGVVQCGAGDNPEDLNW